MENYKNCYLKRPSINLYKNNFVFERNVKNNRHHISPNEKIHLNFIKNIKEHDETKQSIGNRLFC